jgi:uncharacterized protein
MMTRRKFLALCGLAIPSAAGVNAAFIEPTSLQVRELRLNPAGSLRFVHFTDFHYKGDKEYAELVIAMINAQQPAFVCFTGDLVEEERFALPALDWIRNIEAPVYGSPGNHDYASGAPLDEYDLAFTDTGGAWLPDRSLVLEEHQLEIVGMGVMGIHALKPQLARRRLLLLHYPAMADQLQGPRFDLILAGHSHGGQVRFPWIGAPIVPHGVGRYDLGYFDSLGGPLWVNAGIGTYRLPVRFNCRPELTVVTM